MSADLSVVGWWLLQVYPVQADQHALLLLVLRQLLPAAAPLGVRVRPAPSSPLPTAPELVLPGLPGQQKWRKLSAWGWINPPVVQRC